MDKCNQEWPRTHEPWQMTEMTSANSIGVTAMTYWRLKNYGHACRWWVRLQRLWTEQEVMSHHIYRHQTKSKPQHLHRLEGWVVTIIAGQHLENTPRPSAEATMWSYSGSSSSHISSTEHRNMPQFGFYYCRKSNKQNKQKMQEVLLPRTVHHHPKIFTLHRQLGKTLKGWQRKEWFNKSNLTFNNFQYFFVLFP